MVVRTKYDMEISNRDFAIYLNSLKNKVYKLLPLREEALEWEKHLQTVMIEITGLNELIGAQPLLISLLAKLESLNSSNDFSVYRKTIFECLNSIEEIYEQFRNT